jgi:hypothetical protein
MFDNKKYFVNNFKKRHNNMWVMEVKKRKRGTGGPAPAERRKKSAGEPEAKKTKASKKGVKVAVSSSRKRMSVTDYVDMRRQLYKKELEVKKERLLHELGCLENKMPHLTARYQRRELLDSQERKTEILEELDNIQYGCYMQRFEELVAPYYNRLQYVELEPSETTKTTIIKVHPKTNVTTLTSGTAALTLEDSNKTVVLQDEAVGSGDLRERQLQQQLQSDLGDNHVATMRVHMSNCDMCLTCQQPTVIMGAGAIMGCTKCKQTYTFIQATSSRIAYGEEVEFTSFSYRRENHFQEWLNCFQAKESTTLLKREAAAAKNREDTSVVELVAQKCAEMGHTDRSKIEMQHVREALKALRLSKYYENQQQITTRISGRPAPTMTPQQEEQVRCMFSAIIPLFEKHKPPDRRNFLSYAYCLYKFCELMGWDQFLPCFTLLKGPDKLKKQDMIFEKICKDLDWEFIPSVLEDEDESASRLMGDVVSYGKK